MDKTGELPVAETDTRWRANDIRVALMNEFSSDRLWLFVMQNPETMKHEVLAANEWCGQLSAEKLERVRAFCAAMSGRLSEAAGDISIGDGSVDGPSAALVATASR